MHSDITETAVVQSTTTTTTYNSTTISTTVAPYYLTMNSSYGPAYVSPHSGYYTAGSVIQISATIPPITTTIGGGAGICVNWAGSGAGSYSGPGYQANITMNGNINEFATFVSCPTTTTSTSTTVTSTMSTTITPTPYNYIYSVPIGSVINQGDILDAPGSTKLLQGTSVYSFPETALKYQNTAPAGVRMASPYSAVGGVPLGAIIPQSSSGSSSNTGGGVNFNTFTSGANDNIMKVSSAQLSSLKNNYGFYNESELLWITGFPVYDQANSGSIQNQFALLSAGGAYQTVFGTPIPTSVNSIYPTIYFLGQNYTIISMNSISSPIMSTNLTQSGGQISIAPSTGLRTVYVGQTLNYGPWSIQLQDVATSNAVNPPAALAIFYNNVMTNQTSIVPGQTVKINVTNHIIYINVNSSFAGLYAYQKWAKLEVYTSPLLLQSGHYFSGSKGWYVNLLWANTSYSHPTGNGLYSIILYNSTPAAITEGQSVPFIANQSAGRLTFLGDTLGNNFDPVTIALGVGSETYENNCFCVSANQSTTNITEPGQTLTVKSQINNAFAYGGQASSQITYLLTPYTLFYMANAITLVNTNSNATDATVGYGTTAVLFYNDFDAANFINANHPLQVSISGYTTATNAAKGVSFTEPTVQFTGGNVIQFVPLSVPLYSVTGIEIDNGRAIPITRTGRFYIGVENATTGKFLSQLSELSPVILLNPSSGRAYNNTSLVSDTTVTYNLQNGQPQSLISLTTPTSSVASHVRQYYAWYMLEQSVSGSSLSDSLGFGIYNSSTGSSQTQLLQLNYSVSGQSNAATYNSTQYYSIPVKAGFRTEKGSKVASISPFSDTFDMATSIDLLQFAVTANPTGPTVTISNVITTTIPTTVPPSSSTTTSYLTSTVNTTTIIGNITTTLQPITVPRAPTTSVQPLPLVASNGSTGSSGSTGIIGSIVNFFRGLFGPS